MRLLAALTLGAVSLLPACGADAPAEEAGPTGLPEVARVVCDTNGTRAATPAAKPQRDGIHLQIVNVTEEDLGLEIGESEGDPVMGTNADRGRSLEILDFPPGTIRLRCAESRGTSKRDDAWLEGSGVPRECETTVLGTSYFGPNSRGAPTPAEAVKQQFSDQFEPGDVLEQLGYTEQETPTLSLVRDGVSVWGFQVTPLAGGGWAVESDSRCG
jgi:hypothetical protein